MTAKKSAILLSLKKEPLEIIQTIDHEIEENVTLVSDDLLHDLDNRPNIHDINEEESTPADQNVVITHLKRKRGRKRKLEVHLVDCTPQRSFSIKWLTKPELRDWLTPVPNKPTYVSCKWCKALLRAHLHDLKKHAASKKHRKHSLAYSNINSSVKEETNRLNLDEYLDITKHEKLSVGRNDQETTALDSQQSECLIPIHIGFIGSGNMAQALISGFLSNGLIEAGNVLVSAPSNKNLVKLKPLGIKTTNDNKSVIEESDVVFLAVKPHIIPEVLGRLEPIEGSHNPLFVSIATGLSINRLEAMLSHVVSVPRVIRIMPNTPCMVLQGCCVYSLGTNVQPQEGKMLKCLLGSIGLCEEVPEYQIDAVCGVAGSGPAYIYAAIEAMADGGVKMGLPRTLAMALAAQTVKGAATMVLETGRHPGQLKDEVCSPGGTTIAAMHVLEQKGLRNALISAVEASAKRSKELG